MNTSANYIYHVSLLKAKKLDIEMPISFYLAEVVGQIRVTGIVFAWIGAARNFVVSTQCRSYYYYDRRSPRACHAISKQQ